jgi:hypothetical protein
LSAPRAFQGAVGGARLLGLAAGAIVSVEAVRCVGPSLFTDAEPSWASARLLLGIGLAALSGACAVVLASLFLIWSRTESAGLDPSPLAFSRGTLTGLFLVALVAGALARFAAIEELPYPTWHDDLLLAPRALELEGRPSDFRDAVRPVTDGRGLATGSVGVLYLEAYRLTLLACGTTVFGVRLLSVLGGILSLATAAALGRALLAPGGGSLVAVLLAGLRWHLILSRWSWNMILLAPILDGAALLALTARRRASLAAAAAAGVVAGIGAHVYLAAWIGLAALLLFLGWPVQGGSARTALPAVAFAGFLTAVLPLFLLREGRRTAYFTRSTRHNVLVEMKQSGSPMPLLSAGVDGALAPWFLSDPEPRHDLPGKKRLPVVAGAGLALALLLCLRKPESDLSAFLLSHAAGGLAASAAWGEQLSPNGSRFGYLTGVAAIGAAAGLLWLVRLVPERRRRAASLLVVGLVLAADARAIGDLTLWGRIRPTFDSFIGQETLVGRAALRWSRYGEVKLESSALDSPLVVRTIERLAIAPRAEALGPRPAAPPCGRFFRLLAPGSAPAASERIVEHIRDAWDREWAVVSARLISPPGRCSPR